jgi:hypothetical protein
MAVDRQRDVPHRVRLVRVVMRVVRSREDLSNETRR